MQPTKERSVVTKEEMIQEATEQVLMYRGAAVRFSGPQNKKESDSEYKDRMSKADKLNKVVIPRMESILEFLKGKS